MILPDLLDMIYDWMTSGADEASLEKFDTALWEPPMRTGTRDPDTLPGWSDEETLQAFMKALPGMNGARVGAALTPGSATVNAG